ncbi:hypothetical protein L210DRAFT_989452 [Boletus edulis BED1]|uniref:Uncharacterized protein n=1 Tax=Boletus edulis BED1 TaxID=1328754 RepID=A0AAD4BTG7_BOLED|nr:hypothetical protein L210DRAFT_989452 [Boletus edulis BED1]
MSTQEHSAFQHPNPPFESKELTEKLQHITDVRNVAANYVCGPPLSGPITIKKPRYPDSLSPTPPPRTTHSPSTGSESDDESGSTTASETSFRSTHSDYPYNNMSMVGMYHLNGQGTPRAYFNKYFNPVESLARTMNRFMSIPLIDGVFDGQGRYTPTISYTQHFVAPLEYSDEQVSVPFMGHFPPVYVGTALIQLGIAFRNLKEYQRQLCDADGLSRSQLLSRYLPNIYHGRLHAYELHVFRSNADYSALVHELRALCRQMRSVLQSVHAVLTPTQSALCISNDITVYALHGNVLAPVTLHCGEFIQQYTPSANPLFSVDETGFLCSACSVLRFHGQVPLAQTLDVILQTPLPDEDFIGSLLTYSYLDNRAGMIPNNHGGPRPTIKWFCYLANHLRAKQECYYWLHGGGDIVPPPSAPSANNVLGKYNTEIMYEGYGK